MILRVNAAVLAVSLAACAPLDEQADEQDEQLGGAHEAIVYGEDNRLDVHAVTEPAVRDVARSSLVALIRNQRLQRPSTGGVNLLAPKFKDALFKAPDKNSYRVCEQVPFREQKAAADCTGVLIDDDLVLTAGHCFEDETSCDGFGYVFDFFEAAPGALEHITSADVFGCRQIVARRFTEQQSAPVQVDFAVVQLDRVPSGRVPVALRTSALLQGEPLTVIGYPTGLPAKVDQGARVVGTRAAMGDYFHLNSDTFAGSSGSGVFDAQRKLLGVLVRGGTDFILDPAGMNCLVPYVASDDTGSPKGWEEATYVKQALTVLCEVMRYPSPRVCKLAPRCGDGFCTRGETLATCPGDCTQLTCQDDSCGKPKGTFPVGQPLLVEPGHDGGAAKTDAGPIGPDGDDGPTPDADGCAMVDGGARPWAALLPWALGWLWLRRRRF